MHTCISFAQKTVSFYCEISIFQFDINIMDTVDAYEKVASEQKMFTCLTDFIFCFSIFFMIMMIFKIKMCILFDSY